MSSWAGWHRLRLEYHDTVPAVAAVSGLVLLVFVGAVYAFNSLMQPIIQKKRASSYSLPTAVSGVSAQSEAPPLKDDRHHPESPGPAAGIRVVHSSCDETSCTVECNEDEMLLTAYCGPKRNTAITPTERSATCRSQVPVNSPIIAACAKM
jgi:hypothetical protein